MLILLANPNPLHCQSITGNPAIAGRFNASWFSKEFEQPMGIGVVSATLGDRIFRLIQSESNLETYIDSSRYRQSPEPT